MVLSLGILLNFELRHSHNKNAGINHWSSLPLSRTWSFNRRVATLTSATPWIPFLHRSFRYSQAVRVSFCRSRRKNFRFSTPARSSRVSSSRSARVWSNKSFATNHWFFPYSSVSRRFVPVLGIKQCDVGLFQDLRFLGVSGTGECFSCLLKAKRVSVPGQIDSFKLFNCSLSSAPNASIQAFVSGETVVL